MRVSEVFERYFPQASFALWDTNATTQSRTNHSMDVIGKAKNALILRLITMENRIFNRKVKIINEIYFKHEINIRDTAIRYKISRTTLKKYISDIRFYQIQTEADKNDIKSYISHLLQSQKTTKNKKQQSLVKNFPAIYDSISNFNSNRKIEWLKYKSAFTDGLGFTQFTFYFSQWLKENSLIVKVGFNPLKYISIKDKDLIILKKWRNSTDRRKWEKAVVLLDLARGKSVKEISSKIERGKRKVIRWAKSYAKNGLKGLETKGKKFNDKFIQNIETKKSNLMKLIHETPKNFGINRASWDLKSLSAVYSQVYCSKISKTMISEYIKNQGYAFRKAKKVLTSPDPNYREKLINITNILENLTEKQSFFSVDEFGPFAIKIQGGRSIVKNGEVKTYPQWQISKGSLICTAGLELSHNQITHFYSLKKNTDEMIKLLEILLLKYKYNEKIYFSWDAASWHASKKLNEKIKEINAPEYRQSNQTPFVELAPLPASAQFLNVIESVFSGMSKAIIHNSDYQSVDDCKSAIDKYFADRNEYFRKHPKRAGKKIWGKEANTTVFDETKNFKDPRWR